MQFSFVFSEIGESKVRVVGKDNSITFKSSPIQESLKLLKQKPSKDLELEFPESYGLILESLELLDKLKSIPVKDRVKILLRETKEKQNLMFEVLKALELNLELSTVQEPAINKAFLKGTFPTLDTHSLYSELTTLISKGVIINTRQEIVKWIKNNKF